MLLKRPIDGCPNGTFDSLYTCLCEDHCSWKTCRLLDPPDKCLISIFGAVWARDSARDAWVAVGITH